MFALAAMIMGMTAFKSTSAAPVKGADSIAIVSVDSLSGIDTLKSADTLMHIDSLAGRMDSLSARMDSISNVDSLGSVDTSAAKGIDSLSAIDSLKKNDSLRTVEAGSITGKISPAEGAAEVEAVNGADKLKGAISQGAFTIPAAKAGTYTVTIHGKAPFKNAVIKDVKVEDGKATDLGEIKLEQ